MGVASVSVHLINTVNFPLRASPDPAFIGLSLEELLPDPFAI
jgi:hypothetical protein